MKRSRLKQKPRKSKDDPVLMAAFWRAVAYRKKCVVCGSKKDVHAHHVVEKQYLAHLFPRGANGKTLAELRADPRNGIALCAGCHERHTNASRRVPIDKLPAAAFEFAAELGLQHRLGRRFYAAPERSAAPFDTAEGAACP